MKNKKTILISILLIFITITFFTYNVTITYDSSHYLWLTDLLSPNDSFSNWDVARGCVFPLFIYVLNIIFGINTNALLIGMFFNYMILLVICYLIYEEFFNNNSNKIYNVCILITLFILIAFNPIVFGYYHTLLTEFISITIAALACYLCWKFIYIDYDVNKIKFWSYTVIFAILAVISWNLKQPYVGTVIYPLIISFLIYMFKKPKITNVLFKILSIMISVAVIVCSIIVWNKILVANNVKQNSERDSSGFFARQLVEGVSYYNRDFHDFSYTEESIRNNARISDQDKEKIYTIMKKQDNEYSNFIILRSSNIEKDKYDYILYTKDKNLSTGEAIKFVVDMMVNKPIELLKSYVDNYLAIINIYQIYFESDVNKLVVVKKFDILSSAENSAIAYKIYGTNTSNVFPLNEDYYKYAENYFSKNQGLKICNFIMENLKNISIIVFKFSLAILPFEILLVIIIFIITKKRMKLNGIGQKLLDLIFILLIFSFLNICSHAVLGASIDRYAISSYVTNVIAIVLLINFFVNIKNYKM